MSLSDWPDKGTNGLPFPPLNRCAWVESSLSHPQDGMETWDELSIIVTPSHREGDRGKKKKNLAISKSQDSPLETSRGPISIYFLSR